MRLKRLGKRLLFPGLDLNTRCRYRHLPQYFRKGPIETLDAGCGNGALVYAAYGLGNRVLGVTSDPQQVQEDRRFFSSIGADLSRIRFEVRSLYDLVDINQQFDQIICSETLEHIRQDALIISHFHQILRPGGVLHLCSPFALHPRHHLGRIDNLEDGGHVRDGYTLESYRTLLQPIGFEIVKQVGLGSPLLELIDRPIRFLRNTWGGDALALPLFLLTWPLQLLDRPNPKVPFSLYVQAVKPFVEPGRV